MGENDSIVSNRGPPFWNRSSRSSRSSRESRVGKMEIRVEKFGKIVNFLGHSRIEPVCVIIGNLKKARNKLIYPVLYLFVEINVVQIFLFLSCTRENVSRNVREK